MLFLGRRYQQICFRFKMDSPDINDMTPTVDDCFDEVSILQTAYRIEP
jgi:hypothetical protein